MFLLLKFALINPYLCILSFYQMKLLDSIVDPDQPALRQLIWNCTFFF